MRSGIFLTNLKVVSSGDETLSNAQFYFSNEMILEREIKDAKMSSFSSDFQTLTFPLCFLYELLMSLGSSF